MSTMAAAIGASVHIFTDFLQAGFISAIGALIFFFLLMSTPDNNGKGLTLRVGYLLGFTFLTGVGMGPLLDYVIMVDPSIIITAFIGTSAVFLCFSICALLSERGKWLYLGGTLMSIITGLMLLSLANIFFGAMWVYQAQLYVGLLAMCGFVLYDTQVIVEKRRMGSKDFVAHSLDLFIDFIGIFKRLLIILTQKVIYDRYIIPFTFHFPKFHSSVFKAIFLTVALLTYIDFIIYLFQEQDSRKKRRD